MNNARILSVGLQHEKDPDDLLTHNVGNIVSTLEWATRFDPDFVCFPEACVQNGCGPVAIDHAQPVPGRITSIVAEHADELDAYVFLPMIEDGDDGCYNTAVLLSPDGELEGTYRKTHPTVNELDGGISPGEDVPVWETPHGRVGAAICFDVNYPAIGRQLGDGRTDLLFFPSMFPGGRLLSMWAFNFDFFVVQCTSTKVGVVTPDGETLAGNDGRNVGLGETLSTGATVRYGFAEVNIDRAQYHLDDNRDELERIRETFPDEFVLHKYSDEGFVVLESVSDARSIADVEERFGLVRRQRYLRESERRRRNELA